MQLITSIAFLLAAASGVVCQLRINTPPSITECQPTQLTWTGGTPPYLISFLPGGQISATPFETLAPQSGTSTTWIADLASGTSITIQIKDASGDINFSSIVSIQPGTTNSCVGKNSSVSGSATSSGSSGASTTSSGATTTPASVTTAGTSSASSPTTVSNAASSAASSGTAAAVSSGTAAASSSTTKPNAALSLSSSSASGLIGVILAALLA